MDDKMISEAGKYLKDISSQGFETYVQGVWASSIVYTLIGLICLALIPFVYKFADRSIDKVEEKSFLKDSDVYLLDPGTAIVGIGWVIIAILVCSGLLLVGFNIIGVFAPDYIAIKEIIRNIKG